MCDVSLNHGIDTAVGVVEAIGRSVVYEDARMWQQLGCAIDDLLDGAQRIEQFLLFDLLTGVGGVLEFGTTSPQGRKHREGLAELSTDCLFDGEVATFLGRPKALLRKHSDEGEPRCVVGGDVRLSGSASAMSPAVSYFRRASVIQPSPAA